MIILKFFGYYSCFIYFCKLLKIFNKTFHVHSFRVITFQYFIIPRKLKDLRADGKIDEFKLLCLHEHYKWNQNESIAKSIVRKRERVAKEFLTSSLETELKNLIVLGNPMGIDFRHILTFGHSQKTLFPMNSIIRFSLKLDSDTWISWNIIKYLHLSST